MPVHRLAREFELFFYDHFLCKKRNKMNADFRRVLSFVPNTVELSLDRLYQRSKFRFFLFLEIYVEHLDF